MEVYNTQDKKETEEIVAIGNVFITRGLKKAKGDKGIYLDKLQKIILTGTPKATAWEESNMIEGRELIFLLEKDRFIANNRVRMKIYPKDKDNWSARDKLQKPQNRKIWTVIPGGQDYRTAKWNNFVESNYSKLEDLFTLMGFDIQDYHRTSDNTDGTKNNKRTN